MAHPFKHFATVFRHRRAVIHNCARAGILWQGLRHDLSKYSPTEFLPSAHYFQGTRSPNVAERLEVGYSRAWMHHKGRNRHHLEYWTDYDPNTHRIEPVEMPRKYLIEMFCDRVAASKIYQKDAYTDRHPLDYFLKSKKTRSIHPATSEKLERLLTMLAEKGEAETFAYIRAHKHDL